MKLLIFGIGIYYERCKKYFCDQEIVGLLDNNPTKIGTFKDGIEILSPEVGVTKKFDKVFILTTQFIEDIEEQLISLGVSKEKICTLYDIKYELEFSSKSNPITIFSNDSQYTSLFLNTNYNVAVLTNSLGINGGDMTVLYVAKVLRESYNVHVISKMDGPLRKRFDDLNVPVIIDDSIMMKSIDKIQWADSYDLIFANGLMFYGLFDTPESTSNVNAVWWIHSSGDMNKHIHFDFLNNVPQRRVSVYGVSDRAIDSFKNIVPSWTIGKLCYGLEEDVKKINKTKTEKIIFAIIGSVCARKAQNIFIDAINQLPEYKRNKCEFWIIGSAVGKTFGEKILKQIESMPFIKYCGVMDNESLLKDIYPNISVLVCPSLEDTMPIVCAEAMMYSHPCIVSNNTGTAQFIKHKENGLIVKSGDINDLAEKIEWMIDNRLEIKNMGQKAKEVYKTYYSISQFKNNLLHIMKNKLEEQNGKIEVECGS